MTHFRFQLISYRSVVKRRYSIYHRVPKLSYFIRLWRASTTNPKSNNPVPKSIKLPDQKGFQYTMKCSM